MSRPEGRRSRQSDGRRSRSGARHDGLVDETVWLTELAEEPDPDEEQWTGELRAIHAAAPHAKAPPGPAAQDEDPHPPPPQPQQPAAEPRPAPFSIPPDPRPPWDFPGFSSGAAGPAAASASGEDRSTPAPGAGYPDAPGGVPSPADPTPGWSAWQASGLGDTAPAQPAGSGGLPAWAPEGPSAFGSGEWATGWRVTPEPAAPGSMFEVAERSDDAGFFVPDAAGPPAAGDESAAAPASGGTAAPWSGQDRGGELPDTGSWSPDPDETSAWEPDFLSRPWAADARDLEQRPAWEAELPRPPAVGYGSLFADPAPSLLSPSPGQEPGWGAPGQEAPHEPAWGAAPAGPEGAAATGEPPGVDDPSQQGWQPDGHAWLWSAGDRTSPGAASLEQDPWADPLAAHPWRPAAEAAQADAYPAAGAYDAGPGVPGRREAGGRAPDPHAARAWQPEPAASAADLDPAWQPASGLAELDVQAAQVDTLGGRRVRETPDKKLRRAAELRRADGDPLVRQAELRRSGQAGGRRLRSAGELDRPRWPRAVAIVTWILLAMVVIWFYVFPWLERVLPSNF